MHAHQASMGEVLLWGILNVAVCFITAAVLCRVLFFMVTRVIKFIHTDGGNFQQLV